MKAVFCLLALVNTLPFESRPTHVQKHLLDSVPDMTVEHKDD